MQSAKKTVPAQPDSLRPNLVLHLSPSPGSYRPEVDGLRALSVIAVILYHANFQYLGRGWVPGGFVGVDIFFVISGYLISKGIFAELATTSGFRFGHFWERRARRILPAQLLVLLVSLPFAWYLLLPTAFMEYAQSLLATLTFSSNFFFYFATTEYGAESSLLKPLLHTWSLGIEEQFYLLFPFFAVGYHKYFRVNRSLLLLGVTLASLWYCERVSATNLDLGFYSPVSRLWELSIGALVATQEFRLKSLRSQFLSEGFPLLGITLIGYFIFFLPENIKHPGIITLVPVIGAALILGTSNGRDLVGRALSFRPLVFVGLTSFSLYLWHYPVMAFLRATSLFDSQWAMFAGVLGTFGLAGLSFYWVEKPFRDKSVISKKTFLLLVGLAFGVLVSASGVILWQDGNLGRTNKFQGLLNEYEIDNQKLRRDSLKLLQTNDQTFKNALGTKVLVLGDSHAKDMYNVLVQNEKLFRNLNFSHYSLQLCCLVPSRVDANRFFRSDSYLKSDVVMIASRYGKRRQFRHTTHTGSDIEGIKSLVSRVKRDGKIAVIVGRSSDFIPIRKVILSDFYVLDAELQTRQEVAQLYDRIENKMFERRKGKPRMNRILAKVVKEVGAIFLDKDELLCDMESERCFGLTKEGHKIYYDSNHLTLQGARFIGKRVANLNWLAPLYRELQLRTSRRSPSAD